MVKFSSAPLIRAVLVVAVATGLAGGVTYAGLQSQQSKLVGNTIQTATANMQVSTDGTNYSDQQNGFTFSNLIPGGSAQPSSGYNFYLKNAGGAPLSLKLAVSSPPSNPDNADLNKVSIILRQASGGTAQTFTLQSLIDSAATGGVAVTSPSVIVPGAFVQMLVQVSMDSDAINGQGASISNIDLSFSGYATN